MKPNGKVYQVITLTVKLEIFVNFGIEEIHVQENFAIFMKFSCTRIFDVIQYIALKSITIVSQIF